LAQRKEDSGKAERTGTAPLAVSRWARGPRSLNASGTAALKRLRASRLIEGSGERVFTTLGTNFLSPQRTFPACLGVRNCRKDEYRSKNPFPPRTDP
jgi:hypothetical protein